MKGAAAPPVLVAALGTAMLKLAGTVADGTITWMTGTATIGDHIVPTIGEAAAAAGRPAPRVFVSLPVAVTSDVEGAKERINKELAIYPNLPSYRAMLDKEGAESPADVAFIGDEETVAAAVGQLAEAGATDFGAAIIGDAAERERGFALMSELARRAEPPGAGSARAPAQRSSVVYLNSLRSGSDSKSCSTPSMLRARHGGVAFGPAHDAHEHGAPVDHEGRDTEGGPLVDGLLVGPADLLDRRTGLDLGDHLVARDADAVEDAGHHLGEPEVETVVVAGREQGDVRIEEAVGVLVPHHDARRQGHEVLRLVGVVPHRRVALGDVDLAQREREERHVPVGPVGQTRRRGAHGRCGRRDSGSPS